MVLRCLKQPVAVKKKSGLAANVVQDGIQLHLAAEHFFNYDVSNATIQAFANLAAFVAVASGLVAWITYRDRQPSAVIADAAGLGVALGFIRAWFSRCLSTWRGTRRADVEGSFGEQPPRRALDRGTHDCFRTKAAACVHFGVRWPLGSETPPAPAPDALIGCPERAVVIWGIRTQRRNLMRLAPR